MEEFRVMIRNKDMSFFIDAYRMDAKWLGGSGWSDKGLDRIESAI